MEEIIKNAVDEFFEDFAEEIEEEGKDFIKRMFNDKGPGSFDAIYLIGYDGRNCNTELNQLFCDTNNVEFDALVKAIETPETDTALYDDYMSFYEKATALAEEYAIRLYKEKAGVVKKIVYYVEELAHNDSFGDVSGHTFSLDEARKNADYDLSHLTEREKKQRRIAIVGVEVEAIGSAKDSYDAFIDEGMPFDPQFFEIIHE